MPLSLQMKKRTVTVLSVLGAGAIILALIVPFSSKEPLYAGKPLSFWIDQLPATIVTTNGTGRPLTAFMRFVVEASGNLNMLPKAREASLEASNAIRDMGSQCVPFLIRNLNTTASSRLRLVLVEWGLKLHLLKSSSRLARSGDMVRGRAVTGILELGDAAKAAVPDLLVLARSKDPGVSVSARYVLERLAPDELKRLQREEEMQKPPATRV